jgi:hypothetical protein
LRLAPRRRQRVQRRLALRQQARQRRLVLLRVLRPD